MLLGFVLSTAVIIEPTVKLPKNVAQFVVEASVSKILMVLTDVDMVLPRLVLISPVNGGLLFESDHKPQAPEFTPFLPELPDVPLEPDVPLCPELPDEPLVPEEPDVPL